MKKKKVVNYQALYKAECAKNEKLSADREKFRTFIKREIQTQLGNLAEGKYTPSSEMIKRYMVLNNDVEKYLYWI